LDRKQFSLASTDADEVKSEVLTDLIDAFNLTSNTSFLSRFVAKAAALNITLNISVDVRSTLSYVASSVTVTVSTLTPTHTPTPAPSAAPTFLPTVVNDNVCCSPNSPTIIIASVVGGIIIVVLVAVCVYFLLRRRAKQPEKSLHDDMSVAEEVSDLYEDIELTPARPPRPGLAVHSNMGQGTSLDSIDLESHSESRSDLRALTQAHGLTSDAPQESPRAQLAVCVPRNAHSLYVYEYD
jgi:hypothetical protein